MNPNLHSVTKEKRELQMMRRLMPATLASVLMLVLFAPAIAFSQTQTSGALLAIDGTVTNGDIVTPVHFKIYDSQIHTGIVQSVPIGGGGNCVAADQIPTDAYVLQGGAPTGCDPGDSFETSQGIGTASLSVGGSTFAIATQYLENNGDATFCTSDGVTPPICANPDTGFLTVTNSGNDFTGTITLSGTALNPNGISSSYCPTGGTVSDSFTGPLSGAGGFVTLALSTDSSNCGGFNQPQTQTLGPGGAVTFVAGNDTWTDAAVNNLGGEKITFLPVPTRQGSFSPGPLFTGDQCNPYDDFSGPENPVCAPFLLTCSGATDCSTYTHKVTAQYIGPFDQGFPHFLKASGATSPTSNFDTNIFLSLDFVGDPVPKKSGGGGGSSYYAPTFGNTGGEQDVPVSIKGYASLFFNPIKNLPTVNHWEEFVPIPLIWQEFDANNLLVTNPKFFSGGFCKASTPLAICPVNSVALQFVPADCAFTTFGTPTRANAVGNAVIFNPFAIPKASIPANTFNVLAIPSLNFEDSCQVLQVVVTGSEPGLQSVHSAYFHFD
jgi:hypothetical protein